MIQMQTDRPETAWNLKINDFKNFGFKTRFIQTHSRWTLDDWGVDGSQCHQTLGHTWSIYAWTDTGVQHFTHTVTVSASFDIGLF